MSLNWSTKNVKYFKDNPDSLFVKHKYEGTNEEYEDLNAETKALVFVSMSLGIGNLDYKTAPDFYARCKVFERYDDYYLYSTFIDGVQEIVYVTPQIIFKHLGLSTNVSLESETNWIKRISKNYSQEYNSGYRDDEVSEKEITAFVKNAKNEFYNSFNTPKETGE